MANTPSPDQPPNGAVASALDKSTKVVRVVGNLSPQQLLNVLVIAMLALLGFGVYQDRDGKVEDRRYYAEVIALVTRTSNEEAERLRIFFAAERERERASTTSKEERERMFWANEMEKNRKEIVGLREAWAVVAARLGDWERALKKLVDGGGCWIDVVPRVRVWGCG